MRKRAAARPPCISTSALLAALSLAHLSPAASAAVGDGPRAYQPVPDRTNILSLYGIGLRGNRAADPGTVLPNGDLSVDLAVAQYSRAISVGGVQAAVIAALPYGSTDGRLTFPNIGLEGDTVGFGDIILGGAVTLVGPPPLALEGYLRYDPELVVGVLAKLTVPTGRYHADQLLNMGANRYALQVGLPTSYYWGDSFLDARLTSFEILPSVTFYGDNDDPFGSARTVSQDVMFMLETHVTHNVHQAVWLSLDAVYAVGGETTTDDVSDDNRQESLAVGATANVSFSATKSLKVSYGESVWSNDTGPDGHAFRAVFTWSF